MDEFTPIPFKGLQRSIVGDTSVPIIWSNSIRSFPSFVKLILNKNISYPNTSIFRSYVLLCKFVKLYVPPEPVEKFVINVVVFGLKNVQIDSTPSPIPQDPKIDETLSYRWANSLL